MKTLFITFSLLFLSLSNAYCQDYKIKWGTEFSSKDNVNEFYLVNENDFIGKNFAYRNKGKMIEINDLNVKSKTEFTFSVNGDDSDVEATVELGGKIYILSSVLNKEKTKRTLYYHEFKKSATKVDFKGVKLVSFDFDKTQKRRADFTILVSKNKENLCVIYRATANKKADNAVYGYTIYDQDFKITQEGEFKDILESKVDVEENIESYYITNKGSLFIVTEKVQKSEPTYRNVYRLNDGEIKQVNIDLKKNYATEILLEETDNGNVMVSGFWGKPYAKGVTKGTGVKGVFYCLLNPVNEEILSSGFNEFGEDFILEGMTERQKEKTKKKNERKEIEPSLRNFEMREFTSLPDGGYFGIAEFYQLIITTYRDPKTGATTTTYTYYYNDLIAFKMAANGEIEWQKKIFKDQISTNDGGALSSFVGVETEGKYILMFNDNVENYDPMSNEYTAGELPSRMKGGKKNVVAVVEIDLETGKIDRHSAFGKSDIGMYIMPKLSHSDEASSSIILNAAKGKKRKIGRIEF